MKRGDVVLVRFPHSSGVRAKKRPAVVVQSDVYTAALNTVVVAKVTTNLKMKADPACLFIDVNTPEVKGDWIDFRGFGRFELGDRRNCLRQQRISSDWSSFACITAEI